jgi:hypothetical protein
MGAVSSKTGEAGALYVRDQTRCMCAHGHLAVYTADLAQSRLRP